MRTSNPGNFVLLVLAVWGAVVDNRYMAKGGRRPPKGTAIKLAVALVLIFVVIGLRGASAESIGYLAGAFFVLGFAGYEAWRWYVRRTNPLPVGK